MTGFKISTVHRDAITPSHINFFKQSY